MHRWGVFFLFFPCLVFVCLFGELLFTNLSFLWSNVYIWGCHLSETCIQSLPRDAEWSIPPALFPNLCFIEWKLRIVRLSYAGTWSIKIYAAEELVWVGNTFHRNDIFCYCCARGWHNKVKLYPLTWSAVSSKSVLKQRIVHKYCRTFRLWLRSVFQTQLMHVKWSLSCGIDAEGSLVIKLLFFVSW